MKGGHYKKWFTQKLLQGVLVMEHAQYHSAKLNKVSCISSLKNDIQAWLSGRSVAWSSDMVKAEFMKLINSTYTGGDIERVDCIAEAAGKLLCLHPTITN